MVDNCPNCETPLTIRNIKKKLAFGSIEYPVLQICPKCSWTKDLTGAGNIVAKPMKRPVVLVRKEKSEDVKPSKSVPAGDFNKIMTMALVLFVIAAIILAFYTISLKKTSIISQTNPATGTPVIPVFTTNPAVAATTSINTPAVTAKWVLLDYYRIYRNEASKIKSGDKVTWKNIGKDHLTLLSDNIPDFGERPIEYDKITSYTFTRSGTYTYYLSGKSSLNGTIVVEP
ncbi:MAG: hypothetical protein J5U17_08775 [Candidatus Methanoperedens sp.]|nr:hypothetical protein [Candidatus Methanoperedens sp.]MCE8425855.1 hypothetical protein [Candidatus Methanoperedens sp.]MCE8427627.1 hypothetical protein [Candidatus Methanoperedens sp.]